LAAVVSVVLPVTIAIQSLLLLFVLKFLLLSEAAVVAVVEAVVEAVVVVASIVRALLPFAVFLPLPVLFRFPKRVNAFAVLRFLFLYRYHCQIELCLRVCKIFLL
jgi:hypothetical protein